MKKWILMCVFVGVGAVWAGAAENDMQRFYIRIFPEDFRGAMADFSAAHDDIAGVNQEMRHIDLIVPEERFRELADRYSLEILRTPWDPVERVDPQYKNPAEIESILSDYHDDFPSITQLVSIGLTEEGRTIWAMKISDNPMVDEDEPAVLFNAQHHAREVMTPEVVLDTIDYLCSGYGSDPNATQWVDSLEIWLVPQVNPDGANYVFTQYDMWRKDRHHYAGSSQYGIDPNRNYPAFWGSCNGSSGYPSDDDYRGEAPGDSYCVQNMMSFAETIRPIFDISYHSYSELVIYSYGCDGDFTPEHDALSGIGQTMGSLIERDNGGMGYSPGTSWQLLYATDGGDIDWYYRDLGTFAYVIEVNSDAQGFLPSYSQWRDDTVARLRPAWQYLLNRVEGPMITGIVTDACTGTVIPNAVVEIVEIPLTAVEQPRTTNEFGRFYRPVVPGEYHVTVSAPGYDPVTVPVGVSQEKVELDIGLIPDGEFGLFIAGYTIHDDGGDQDGEIDPGETVAMELSLYSIGTTTNVGADLISTDPFLTIITGHAEFGEIPDGTTGNTQAPHFQIAVDPGCPEQHELVFDVMMSSDQALCANTGSFSVRVTSYEYQCPIYLDDLSSDPGYEIINSGNNGWEFGQPSAGPVTGHSGSNCYGTNLDGHYSNYGTYQLVSNPFDCSDVTGAELYFWRWLDNEIDYDTAYVEISTDHSSWMVLWSGYATDNQWVEQTFDISAIADGEAEVYIRWRLNSDSYVTENGYYIDDIMICGKTIPEFPPTPAPTWTQGPSPTPASTHTPYPTYTAPPEPTPTAPPGQPTYTPFPTGTPAPTATPTFDPNQFTARLHLNNSMFEAGEPFLLTLQTLNNTDHRIVANEFLILDVYGMYFFHPGWSEALDFQRRSIDSGEQLDLPILDFVWPPGAGSADNLKFWLGYVDVLTNDLVGNIDSLTFGYR